MRIPRVGWNLATIMRYLTSAFIQVGEMKLAVPTMLSWFQLSSHFHWAIGACIVTVTHQFIIIEIRVIPAGQHLSQYALMGKILALIWGDTT